MNDVHIDGLEQVDSRRLTGPNLLWPCAGAVLDVRATEPAAEAVLEQAIEQWRIQARSILDAVGWPSEETTVRRHRRGASLALSAPLDALYAATEVNECAWEAAQAVVLKGEPADLEQAAARLRSMISNESRPALRALQEAAGEHGVRFLCDDEQVSVGSGGGVSIFDVDDIPPPDELAWEAISDIPVVAVTGTNGKTTTVRLLAAIADAAGITPAACTTDGIVVGDRALEDGDFAGPGGARTVLRQQEADLAVVEVARGGLLRRGMGTDRVEVAVITNVAADHLGELGVETLDDLADVKMIPGRSAACVVLDLEDERLVRAATTLESPVAWFCVDPDSEALATARCSGATACTVEDGSIVCYRGPELRPDGAHIPYRRLELTRLDEVPITLEGRARHNVANALAAVVAAVELGLSPAAIRAGLTGFGRNVVDNPGRLNGFLLGGATALVDFAHNPAGLEALLDLAEHLEPERTLVVLGQAGDRDDEAIRELAAVAAAHSPDRIVIKSLDAYLRGREPGAIEEMIEDELRTRGVTSRQIQRAAGELDALRRALAWASKGDLLLLPVHSDRDAVLSALERLTFEAWQPGEPVPEWLWEEER